MKKAIAAAAVGCALLRLAVLSGAGDALGAWAKEKGLDARAVTAALTVELGVPPEPVSQAKTEEPETPASSPAAAEVRAVISATPVPAEAVPPEPEETAEIVPLAIPGGAAVHDRTSLGEDLGALAAEGLSLRLPAGQPQILILHTHTSEAYTQDDYDRYDATDPYRTTDPNYSVVRVGDALAEALEHSGLTVIHDRELYDYPSYTGSYSRSGAAVERYLADYPSLRVVIDLHRDAIGSGDVVYKTQATLDGKPSAQVMLLVGTGENGLYHPLWRENLKLALYLRAAAEDACPTLTRPIELVSERYNQQLSTGSILMEVGSTGNTLAEAVRAAELFGGAVGPALAQLVETSG